MHILYSSSYFKSDTYNQRVYTKTTQVMSQAHSLSTSFEILPLCLLLCCNRFGSDIGKGSRLSPGPTEAILTRKQKLAKVNTWM